MLNNVTSESMPYIRSIKNLDEIFIKEKLIIFKDYLEEEEINRFEEDLRKKAEAIEHLNYGKYS
jgi:hypothetical protein